MSDTDNVRNTEKKTDTEESVVTEVKGRSKLSKAAARRIEAARKKQSEYKDMSDMTEEEIQAPIKKFKTKFLPIVVAVLGCIAAVVYMMWVFGVFGK